MMIITTTTTIARVEVFIEPRRLRVLFMFSADCLALQIADVVKSGFKVTQVFDYSLKDYHSGQSVISTLK